MNLPLKVSNYCICYIVIENDDLEPDEGITTSDDQKHLEELNDKVRSLELKNESIEKEMNALQEENQMLKRMITEKTAELDRKDGQLRSNNEAIQELMTENNRMSEEYQYLSDIMYSGAEDSSKEIMNHMHATIEKVEFHLVYDCVVDQGGF